MCDYQDCIIKADSIGCRNGSIRRGCCGEVGASAGAESAAGAVLGWRPVGVSVREAAPPAWAIAAQVRAEERAARPEPARLAVNARKTLPNLGAGALIREGRTIGAFALAGMDAVVTRDVSAREVWAGIPARVLRAADIPS